MGSVIKKRNRQGGFSFMELMIALLIIIILVAVVILAMQGFFTKARGSGMEVDKHSVKTAVDAYAIQSGEWPTTTGALPETGQKILIDFSASFNRDGKIVSFYPHFVTKLPRHAEEGVWFLDSAALVSVDMNPDDY
jgi:type II secretory pathway pseudopilin PulG